MLAKIWNNTNSDTQMVKYIVPLEDNLTVSSEAEISTLTAQQFHYKLYIPEKLLYTFSKR